MNEPQMNYMQYGHYNSNNQQPSQIEYISMLDGFNPNQPSSITNSSLPNNNNSNNSTNAQYGDRDQKRLKQEEYKKILDFQRQEELNRIANEKQSTLSPQAYNQNDRNRPLTGIDIGRGSSIMPNDDMLKERERQKKMEYHQLLQQQIDEKNKQKEIEKQKEKEEQLKFEKKFQQISQEPIVSNSKARHGFNQMLTTDELIKLQQQQMQLEQQQQQLQQRPQLQQKQQKEQLNQSSLNNNNNNYNLPPTQYSQFEMNNVQQSSTYQRNSQTFNNNTPLSMTSQQFHSKHIINDNYPTHNDIQRNNQPNYDQYPSNNITYNQPQDQYFTNNNRQSNQFTQLNTNTYNPSQRIMDHQPQHYYPPRQESLMGMTMTQQSNPNFANQAIQQPQMPMLSYEEINNIFLKFMSRQMAFLSEFESKINRIESQLHNKPKSDIIASLNIEKNNTMDRIKNDQEDLKSCIGFYPMQNEFNNKMSNLLNIITEKKLQSIPQLQEQHQKKTERIQSARPLNSYINNTYQNSQEAMASQSKVFNTPIQQKYNNPLPINTSQIIRDIEHINYRSKYEDLKQSIMNFDDVMPEIKQSLIGFSKMVHANNKNISSSYANNIIMDNSQNLYQTWKGDWRPNKDPNPIKLEAITEEINKDPNYNYNDDNNNFQQYNISQSKILMTKSNNCSMTEKSFDQNLNLLQNNEHEPIEDMIDKDNNIRQSENNLSKSINRRNENICNPNFYIEDEDDDDNNNANIAKQQLNITNQSYTNKSQSIIKESIKASTKKEPKDIDNKDEVNEYDDNEFENEKTLVKITKKIDNNLNLDDYEDIRESQKFETQLNFFEDSYIDNVNIKKSKQHIINPASNISNNNYNKKLQRSQSPKLKPNNNNNNNKRQVDDMYDQSRSMIDKSQNCTNPMIDSYGDNILKDLDKYRQMALDQSSMQKSYLKK